MNFTPPLTPSLAPQPAYATDDARWAAVCARDPAADRAFVYGVRTTKIYCRPICKARLARRQNVTFYGSALEAQHAGFRACKRCKPELASRMPEEDAVRKIQDFVARERGLGRLRTLNEMARATGLSKWHFHRVFKKVVGMTPNEYARMCHGEGGAGAGASRANMNCEVDALHEQQLPYDLFDFDFLLPLREERMGMGLTPISETEPSPMLSGLIGTSPVPSEVDWSNIDFTGNESLKLFSYPTPARTIETSSVAPPLDSVVVHYHIRHTSFGLLLIAFQDGKVCMMQQAENETELLQAMELKYPSYSHEHIRMDDPAQMADPRVQKHTNAILEMLETNVN